MSLNTFQEIKSIADESSYRVMDGENPVKCPMCGANYVSTAEVREQVKCPGCMGQGERAATIDRLCQQELDEATAERDIERLEALGTTFLESYFYFESRIRIRHIKKNEGEKQ